MIPTKILAIALGWVMSLILSYALGWCLGYSKGVKDMTETFIYAQKHLWTPIEEGLPEEDVRVIVAVKNDNSYTNIDTDRILNGHWVRWEGSITHWTELPELPKESEDTE